VAVNRAATSSYFKKRQRNTSISNFGHACHRLVSMFSQDIMDMSFKIRLIKDAGLFKSVFLSPVKSNLYFHNFVL